MPPHADQKSNPNSDAIGLESDGVSLKQDQDRKDSKPEKKVEQPKDPKSHASNAELGDIHSVSIIYWRRPITMGTEIKRGSDQKWSVRHGFMYGMYGVFSVILLLVQITFLWSLMDQFAGETSDKEAKGTMPSVKWTPEMSYLELPDGKVLGLITKWNSSQERCAGAGADVCKEKILACAKNWSVGMPCDDDAAFIRKKCMPWDYEAFLGGMNNSLPIKYVGHDGKVYYGGSPKFAAINKYVILEWALLMDPTCPLYGKLKYSYVMADKFAHGSEILSIAIFSYVFFIAIFSNDLAQLLVQCVLSVDMQHSPCDADYIGYKSMLVVPFQNFLGDIFMALRIIFVSSVTPVCAMLMTKDHGVQSVLTGAVATTFILNLDDLVFSALQKGMMMARTTIFKMHIEPTFTSLMKNRDQSTVWESVDLHFGRFRTTVSVIYCHALYIVSVIMGFNIAMGYRNPSYYFQSSSGFAVVGGLSMGTWLCSCLVMYRGTLRSVLLMAQHGIALLWVYVIMFKIIMYGLLYWGLDVASGRQCNWDAGVCETNGEVVARVLRNHFRYFLQSDDFQAAQSLTGVGWQADLDWTFSSAIIAFYVCLSLHIVLAFVNSEYMWYRYFGSSPVLAAQKSSDGKDTGPKLVRATSDVKRHTRNAATLLAPAEHDNHHGTDVEAAADAGGGGDVGGGAGGD